MSDQTSRYIDIEEMRCFLDELILRAGGVRAAARAMGVSHISVMRWRKSSAWYNENKVPTVMNKNSAALILTTLIALRRHDRQNGNMTPEMRRHIQIQARIQRELIERDSCG